MDVEQGILRLQRVLSETFEGASIIIRDAAGGFVAGLIHEKFEEDHTSSNERRALERVQRENETISDVDERLVIFTIKFYRTPQEIYSVNSLLRVQPDEDDGTTTYSVLGSLDALVNAHEIDAEALMIDPERNHTCEVVLQPNERPSLDLTHIPFRQFDVSGMRFVVEGVDLIKPSTPILPRVFRLRLSS